MAVDVKKLSEEQIFEMAQQEADKREVRLDAVYDLKHPRDFYLKYVLCYKSKKQEWIVWLYNVECGGFFKGEYFKYEHEAMDFLDEKDVLPKGKFESLNFILDHDRLNFTGYEFEGRGLYVSESGSTEYLFRCEVYKGNGNVLVSAAYSEDYSVLDDVTHLFDTDKLLADIQEYISQQKEPVQNDALPYMRYCELVDEGWECEDAMSKVGSEFFYQNLNE
jgi:hypothetical protein